MFSGGTRPAMLSVTHTPEEIKLESMKNSEGVPMMVPQRSERDPKKINEFIKVRFDDLFAEPDDEIYSHDRVWTLTQKVYTVTKYWCYRIFSIICGIPLAVFCGCYFACLSFCMVWCCIPCLRSEEIECYCLRELYTLWANACISPFCSAISNVFSGIKVSLTGTDKKDPQLHTV